jgi:hypothetical protein
VKEKTSGCRFYGKRGSVFKLRSDRLRMPKGELREQTRFAEEYRACSGWRFPSHSPRGRTNLRPANALHQPMHGGRSNRKPGSGSGLSTDAGMVLGSLHWGSIVNMPGQPQQILADLNRRWKDDNDEAFTSRADPYTVNATTAVNDLQANQPLIIGALGHCMVLTALTSDINRQTGAWNVIAATVRDPWPGNGGERILTPREWYNISFGARIRVS